MYSTKIIFILIPLFITLMVWLVSMTYNTNTQIEVIKKDAENRKELQEQILKSVDNINTELAHKLSIDLYEVKHNEVISDIDQLKDKVDKIYNKQVNHYILTDRNWGKTETIFNNTNLTNNTINKVDTNVVEVMGKVDFIYKELGLIPKNDTSYLLTRK